MVLLKIQVSVPFTVCRIFGSDLIFAHSFSLVEVHLPLKFWSFCCNHCFSAGRNYSNKLTLSKHVLSFSWTYSSSVSMSWRFFSGLDSLKKSLYWRSSWSEPLRHIGVCNLLWVRIPMIYALGWICYLSHKLLISSFGAGYNLSFLSADISWLVFPNTVIASIAKLMNVLDSKSCPWYCRTALDIWNIAEVARLINFWMSL